VKRFQLHISGYPRCLKGVALIVFIVVPGSMLLLPLLAWWTALRPTVARERSENSRQISGLSRAIGNL
jgi:hypothetical protein